MGPKKGAKGVKKEVVDPEPPKASTLADGEKSHWLGGWSANNSLSALEALTDPTLKEEACTYVRVMPGTITEENVAAAPAADAVATSDDTEAAPEPVDPNAPKKIVIGSVHIFGQLQSITDAAKATWVEKRAPKAAADGEEGEEAGEAADDGAEAEDGEEGEEGGAQKATSRPAQLYYDDSILFDGNILLEGARPPVEIKIEAPEVTKKAPVAAKGKKKADEEAARAKEAEAQKEREEIARKAAEEEAERLSKFAAPSKFPTITITNISFVGKVQVKDAHVTFNNCHFSKGDDHQVIVHSYCKVKFEKCTFSHIARTGIYAFPLSEVTIENSAFTGISQPRTEQEIQQNESVPKLKKEFDALVATAQLNTNSVAVYGDNAVINISNTVISHVTTGIIFSEKCAGSVAQHNILENIFSIGIYNSGTAASILNNKIDVCGYYGMQFIGRCSGKIMFNNVASTVQVAAGARPLLHTNTLAVKLIDLNDVGTISMQAAY